MPAKLDYRWNLRQVMATRGMFATTDLILHWPHEISASRRARSTASSSSGRSASA